jgi:hypothetical protein
MIVTALGVDLEGSREVLADAAPVPRKTKRAGVAYSKICGIVG